MLKRILIWRRNPLWYAVVLFGPIAVLAVALVISNVSGFTALSFPAPQKILTTFGTVLGVYLLLNTEEIAWRGYALPRLQNRYSPLTATAIIWILWTLFHIPLFLMKGGHPAGYPFWLYALLTAGIVVPFTFVFNGTGGSILFPHMLHQSLNASVESLPIFPMAAHSIAPILISTLLLLAISAFIVLRYRDLKK